MSLLLNLNYACNFVGSTARSQTDTDCEKTRRDGRVPRLQFQSEQLCVAQSECVAASAAQ